MSNSPVVKKIDFSHLPLFWLAVFFSAGIVIAYFWKLDWKISLIVCLINAFFSIVFINRKHASIFLLPAFLFVGAFIFHSENQKISGNRLKNVYEQKIIESGEPLEVEGVLHNKSELAANGFFLELRAENLIYKNSSKAVSGKVRLFAPAENREIIADYKRLELQIGTRVRVACHLRREENYQNPGGLPRLKILDEQQIDAIGTIKSPLLIEKIEDSAAFSPLSWVYRQREMLIVEFRDRFSVSTAGILIASLLGNKYFLDQPTAEVFREGGTFHVLVISGLHITFIGGLTLLILKLLTKKRTWQFIIAATLMWVYALAVGAQIPVVRAAIMFTILLFSQVIYRSGKLLNSLGACTLILLVWRPNDLFTSSFQLTFVSVAAIVAAAFPLIENLREIGNWSPTAEKPFPPRVNRRLKRFCETVYWSEKKWEVEVGRQIWSAKLFKNPHLKWLESKNLQGILQYVFEGVLVSLIVQIWLLPFLVVYFHRLSIASIFLNLWVGFFIALESFTAVFAVFFGQISAVLAFPFITLTETFNALLLLLPQLIVENDLASLRIPHYSGDLKIIYAFYFVPLLALTVFLNLWNPFALKRTASRKNKQKIVCATALAMIFFIAVVVFHPFSAPSADGKLHIDFLDVGQGDSALITLPNGETLLIDAGGKPDYRAANADDNSTGERFEPDAPTVGESVVSAFLWEKGYSKIDYILATHADADHIQGLKDVAKNFRIGAAIFGKTPFDDQDFSELFEILSKRKISSVTVKRGDVLDFGAAKIEVLYPLDNKNAGKTSSNNQSIVFRLIFGGRKILFTGDIEKEVENELLQNPGFLQSDFIKVAHHGSRTSSTENFVSVVGAEYAIVPVGKRSQFGHPHAEIVERWEKAGAKVLTTGERGTISLTLSESGTEIQTFIP